MSMEPATLNSDKSHRHCNRSEAIDAAGLDRHVVDAARNDYPHTTDTPVMTRTRKGQPISGWLVIDKPLGT